MMTKMARQGRRRRQLDLKGDEHLLSLLVVETVAGRERREEDRGDRRRDLRGRPFW